VGRLRKLPAEFGEFRLKDGRYLDEVLGEDFFQTEVDASPGGQFSVQARESLREGVYAPARVLRRDRDRFALPPQADAISGDGGSEERRIGSGRAKLQPDADPNENVTVRGKPIDGTSPEILSDFPVPQARPEPGGVADGEEGHGPLGFRVFDLPLAEDGGVDEDALVPGAVYRIPDSAGGGTGRWKSGAFYNFDQKADWNFRSTGDLDAYSGASDAPTPEERSEELDKTWMPAERLDAAGIEAFRKKSGYGLARSDDGYTLTSPSRQELFDLTDEDAAELARQWTPEIAKQVQTIGVIWRKDLTPAEKRSLFADAIGADDSLDERIPSGRAYGRWVAKSPKRALAHKRLKAFDALAEAMEREASDEEIGTLLGELHAAMLPEVLGPQRFVRELMLDIAPLIGNIRSVRHLQNDIAEVDEAIETGDWSDAALASGMAILDFVGILPGGNLVKEGGKLAGRGLVRSVPYLDGLLAERTIRRFKAQWGDKVNKIDPRRFIGDFFDSLDPKLRKRFGGLVNERVGSVSEQELLALGKRMDPNAADEVGKKLPDGFQIKTRKYDMEATFASDVLTEKNALLGRLARWVANAGGETLPAVKAGRKQIELKTGKKNVPPREGEADKFFAENPDEASKAGVNEVIYLRRHPEEVSIDFVIHDLSNYLDGWVKEGRIGRYEATALKETMKKTWAKGVTRVAVEEYAGLLARLAAATSRDADVDDIARPEFGEDAYP
jgi:hypothetical protein